MPGLFFCQREFASREKNLTRSLCWRRMVADGNASSQLVDLRQASCFLELQIRSFPWLWWIVLQVRGAKLKSGVVFPQVFGFSGNKATGTSGETQLLRRLLDVNTEPVPRIESALLRRVSIEQYVIRSDASILLVASSSRRWYNIEHDTESPMKACGCIDCLFVHLCR